MTSRTRWIIEALGNAPLLQTAHRLAKALAKGNIPHLIVGGMAVQHHGYFRTTLDVDIVVPNVDEARDYLSIRGFKEVQGTTMMLVDRVNRVPVDLLPGGGCVGPCLVKLPVPSSVNDKPQFASVAELITQKLSSYLANPIHRAKDQGDVVELIKLGLPRDLQVELPVQWKYLWLWDGLQVRDER